MTIPEEFRPFFFVNARFNMHNGTYSWEQDGEGSLIELTEWVNVPGYHPSQPIVPKWVYLRKSIEYPHKLPVEIFSENFYGFRKTAFR